MEVNSAGSMNASTYGKKSAINKKAESYTNVQLMYAKANKLIERKRRSI